MSLQCFFDEQFFDEQYFDTCGGGGMLRPPIRRHIAEHHQLLVQVRRSISESVVTQSTIRRPICESVYVDASVRRPVRESVTLTGNVYEKTSMHDMFHDLRDLLLLRQLDKLTE